MSATCRDCTQEPVLVTKQIEHHRYIGFFYTRLNMHWHCFIMWEPLRINSRPEPRTQMLRAWHSALLALFTGGQLPLKNTEGMELGGQMVEVMGTKGPEGLCATGFCKLPEGDWSDVSSFFVRVPGGFCECFRFPHTCSRIHVFGEAEKQELL